MQNYNVILMKVVAPELEMARQKGKFPFPQTPRQAQEDDIILLSEHYKSRSPEAEPIRYRIKYKSCNDLNSTNNLNGRSYRVEILGRDCRELRRGFSMHEEQVSSKNYKRAPFIAYLSPEDIHALMIKNYLD